jgi:hypothetical protein
MVKLKLEPLEGPFLVRTGDLDKVLVPTLRAASLVHNEYIHDEEMEGRGGCRAWTGGEIRREETGEIVAVLGYNGSVWAPGNLNPEGQVCPHKDLEFDLS